MRLHLRTSLQWPCCPHTPTGYSHTGMLWSCSTASGSPSYKMWSAFNTLSDFPGSRPSSSLALVPQQAACKPRTPPYTSPTKILAPQCAGNWPTKPPKSQHPPPPHLNSPLWFWAILSTWSSTCNQVSAPPQLQTASAEQLISLII